MRLAGPELLQLAFHIFVVIVGVLILSGAVNTSIIGANGVLNRVAEDGVLLDWFRKPHKRFGTTFRIINLIALLQLATIVLSRGDVYLLGEAYAFGVVWSFFLKSLGVLVLRYQRHDQEYKFPFNIRLGGVEIPIGLGVTTLILGFVAIANLFSKEYATIYGVGFTLVVFVVFTISEHINAKKRKLTARPQAARRIQPGSSAAGERRHLARAARLRPGGGARLSQHGAPEEGSRKDQPAPPRHRGDDRAHHLHRRRRIRSLRRPDLQRLRAGTVQPRGRDGREGRQAGGAAGGSGRESLRRHGADRGEAQGLAPGDRRVGEDDVGRTGAPHRPGVGKPAGAAPCVFARSDQQGPALHVREPGPASAAPVARRCRPPA